MTGQFQQQVMMQNAMSPQSFHAPFHSPGSQADQLTGTASNMMAGVGSTLGSTAGMVGLTSPLGGAFLGGTLGAFGGPVGMAAGAGIGAAMGTVGSMAGSAMQFGAGNFMQGMQQQQSLNNMMRQQFPAHPGGMGMGRGQMGEMSSTMQGMTQQSLPGGQMMGFEQLQGLAGNMGKMGFSQTLTDVKQFSQRFKEMVDTLKTISTDLGTSLEQAQNMVVGMRGSGIFQKSDQLRATSQMRQNALSGVSMEETQQMMSVGSQISRSIGGRGSQGATAGARTIGEIGIAQRIGAIGEEDIYNATGLSGAEGRMAYAQQKLSGDARFLRSNLGRRLVASMASSGGEVDSEAFGEFMSGGGFSTGETMGKAHKNLSRIGRADFIRNEGRLRGSLMEKGGGNLATMAIQGWLESRGMDASSGGDDRTKILLQRLTGMDREQIDVHLKELSSKGDMETYMNLQREQDTYMREREQTRKQSGFEGMRRSFDQFKHKVQTSVQATGQKAFQDMSSWAEEQLGRMFGQYSEELDANLDQAFNQFKASRGQDSGSRQKLDTLRTAASGFGLSSMKENQIKTTSGAGIGLVENYQMLAQNKSFGGRIHSLLGGKTLEDRLGHHFKMDEGKTRRGEEGVDMAVPKEQQHAEFLKEAEAINRGALAVGDQGAMTEAMRHRNQIRGEGFSKALKEAGGGAAMMDVVEARIGSAGKTGERMQELRSELAQLDAEERSASPARVEEILERRKQLQSERSNLSQSVLKGAGIDFDISKGVPGAGGFAGMTERQRHEAYGEAAMGGATGALASFDRNEELANRVMGGSKDRKGLLGSVLDGAGTGAAFGAIFGAGIGTLPGAVVGAGIGAAAHFATPYVGDAIGRVRGETGGGRDRFGGELGRILAGEDMRDKMVTALTGDEKDITALQDSIWKERDALMKDNQGDSARMHALRIAGAATEIKKVVDPTGKLEPGKKGEAKKIAEKHGFKDTDSMMEGIEAGVGAVTNEAAHQRRLLIDKQQGISSRKLDEYTKLGVLGEKGELSTEFADKLSPEARAYARASLAPTQELAKGTEEGLDGATEKFEAQNKMLASMSSAELKKMEDEFSQKGLKGGHEFAGVLRRERVGRRTAMRATRGGAAAGGDAGRIFGLDKEAQRDLNLMSRAGNMEGIVGRLSEGMVGEDGQGINPGDRERLQKLVELSHGRKDGVKLTGSERESAIAEGRKGLQGVAREQDKREKNESAKDDPTYKLLGEIRDALTKEKKDPESAKKDASFVSALKSATDATLTLVARLPKEPA